MPVQIGSILRAATTAGGRSRTTRPEPAWHRRARKRRTAARTLLRNFLSGSTSALAASCPQCGSHWAAAYPAADTTPAPKRDGQRERRNPSNRRRAKSPRGRDGDNRQRQLPQPPVFSQSGKGTGGKGDKGRKGSAWDPSKGPPNPPKPPSTPSAPSAPAPPAMDPKLQEVLQALNACKDSLPASVRALLSEQEETHTAYKAREMHKHVHAQATKSKKLTALRTQREAYMEQWCRYVDTLAKNLETQIAEKDDALQTFSETEATLLEEIDEATAAVLQLAGREKLPTEALAAAEAVQADPWLPSDHPAQKQREADLVALMQRAVRDATAGAHKRDGSRTPRRKDATVDADKPADAPSQDTAQDASMPQASLPSSTASPKPAAPTAPKADLR